MRPRICTSCPEPHETTDWYVIVERGPKQRGKVECREAHELRIRRETRREASDKRAEDQSS